MKVILLAAGQGFHLEGICKCLIKDPKDNKRIIEKVIDAFPDYPVTVVVGYQAINIMQEFPSLNYVYNSSWGMTNNSYSLALALTTEPCYVLSCDLIFEPDLIKMMDKAQDNIALTEIRESRCATAINCQLNPDGSINSTYQGALKSQTDPEMVGIMKITHPHLLKKWKTNCLKNPNLFVGENLPLDEVPVWSLDKQNHRFHEVNTPLDYQNLIDAQKQDLQIR